MFGPFERTVAGRYLRARKGERFVSIIAIFSLVGIALGVATLIVVTSVMSGFQQELVTRLLAVNGDITVTAYAGRQLDNSPRLLSRIRAIPHVVSAIPMLDGQALFTTNNGGARGGIVRGITLDDLGALHSISDHIVAGSLQVDIVRGLAPDGTGLTVVGDEAQAIYGFRGSDSRHLRELVSTLPGASPANGFQVRSLRP